ncbi:hypothetical protein [Streptomyces sp. 8K308]|uniref:hypothetical protein n=1 Tax=Streptomyces sp. 8K308 TaxID=2530388 RepID=UPI001404CF16|nr:hypothetical protein [Streptomyces sp. 8K308]
MTTGPAGPSGSKGPERDGPAGPDGSKGPQQARGEAGEGRHDVGGPAGPEGLKGPERARPEAEDDAAVRPQAASASRAGLSDDAGSLAGAGPASRRQEAGSTPGAAGGAGGEWLAGVEPDGAEPDGAEIRALFHDAVGRLEPSSGALAQLREAVPMRRRRRRLWIGAAASVALLGIGAPVVMSAAEHVRGDGGEATLDAGGERATGGEREGGGDAGGAGSHPAGGDTEGPGRPGEGVQDGGQPLESGGDSGQATTGDGSDMTLTSPTCSRTQLGQARTTTESPDAEGRVYGAIRLVNVSDSPCRVTGNGELAALPVGMASTEGIQVVDRTEGDRAERLPTPDETHEELVLPPGEAYEVRFAWVPSGQAVDSCAVAAEPVEETEGPSPHLGRNEPAVDEPTATSGQGSESESGGDGSTATGGETSGGETPDDGTVGGETGGGETSGTDSGATTDTGGGESPGTATGGDTGGSGGATDGVVLRYTPAAGQPEAAQIMLEGSCSGTIYRTGVLQAPTQ